MAKYTEWSEELEAALAEPFPSEWIKQKSAGGSKISFVPWHRYVSKLNQLVGGGWSMGAPITMHVGDKLVMGLPVTILGTTRINFGDEDDSEWESVINKETGEEEEKKTMYGSPVTNAFAQAFKRSCALFGVGLDMYDKGGKAAVQGGGAKAQQTARAGFSVDTVVGKGKHKDTTWKQLGDTEEGRNYITWILSPKGWTTISPDQRTALQALVEVPKGSATDAVLLQDLLNQAATVNAITVDQSARIEKVIDDGEEDAMSAAKDWLETQMQKKKLGGA